VEIASAAANGRATGIALPRHLSERRKRSLTTAIEKGRAVPQDQLPRLPVRKSRRPTESEKRRCFQLERRRDQRARELDIDPTLIASRSVLWELARDWDRASGDLMSWQRSLLE
jgi:ribonuclease D